MFQPLLGVAGVGPDRPSGAARHILQTIDHPGVGRQTVASGAAGFLVIGLQTLGQIEVGDEAHIRLVDAHAEGDGGDHHHAVLFEETILVVRPHRLVETGVVGQGIEAVVAQPRGRFFDLGPCHTVDDARVAGVVGLEESQQLVAGIVLGGHPIADIRPIETGDELPAVLQFKFLDDLAGASGPSAVAVKAMRGMLGKR